MHSIRSEDVGDLVRVRHHGGRAEREHEPCELVDEQLGRLEVHVSVDEPGNDEPLGGVDDLHAVVAADACDDAVGDRDVGVEPLSREDRQHAAALDHHVGRLISACNREPVREGSSHGA